MSRYLTVVQIESDTEGNPKAQEEGSSVFVRYAVIDRAKKNKTVFSGMRYESCKEKENEWNAEVLKRRTTKVQAA